METTSGEFMTIYDFESYQAEAIKTASMGKGRAIEGFVRVCGLVGEAAELREELANRGHTTPASKDKIIKELGDVLWYAATLSEWFGLSVHFSFDAIQKAAGMCTFPDSYMDILLVRAGKLAELMKKHLGHDKPIADFKGIELELMQDVFVALGFVANTVKLPLSRVAAVNINKLRARYQGGSFTPALANAHVDELDPVLAAEANLKAQGIPT